MLLAEEIAQFVKAEEAEAGVGAAEILSFPLAEEPVPAADEADDDGQMDAFDEGDKTGIASQFIAELTEGAQTFLSLGYEVGVALKSAEAHRIVDVGDGNVVATQLFAKEYVLIAVIAETLIKGVGEHKVTTDEEIGSMEVAIGILLAYLNCMLMLCSLLVAITEIALECISIATDGYTAINDISTFHRYIFRQIVSAHYTHIAVDEQQPVVMGLFGKEIPDGSTADVLGLSEVMAMLPLGDLAVFADDICIR